MCEDRKDSTLDETGRPMNRILFSRFFPFTLHGKAKRLLRVRSTKVSVINSRNTRMRIYGSTNAVSVCGLFPWNEGDISCSGGESY